MSSDYQRVKSYVSRLLEQHTKEQLLAQLAPKTEPPPPRVPRGVSVNDMAKRLDMTKLPKEEREEIADRRSVEYHDRYVRNIENYIGTVKVPLGLTGPLRVNGLFAQGDYLIPLATTEAALVASYSRGARTITAAGGCRAMLLNEGVGRAPGFIFADLAEAGLFVTWAQEQFETFKSVAAETTRHGQLVNMHVTIEGNHVYLFLEFETGDASGQNMVTIAAERIRGHVMAHSPVKPKRSYVEANLSGDKKASFQSFHTVRGKKVAAEATIPPETVKKYLRTTPARLEEYWRLSAIGGSLSGTIGLQGHYANGLAALYLACGQDVACVSESAIGVTRLEVAADGALYASVNLPNLMVGTVGGGTGLPSQAACLGIMGMKGSDRARAFAEICGALCLAGELSIMAALCTGEFAKAHHILARGARNKDTTPPAPERTSP